MGVRMKTELRDVRIAGKGFPVERLDVGHPHVELESLQIDTPVDDRVEHEAVIRTG
jgi:hypothetical protein